MIIAMGFRLATRMIGIPLSIAVLVLLVRFELLQEHRQPQNRAVLILTGVLGLTLTGLVLYRFQRLAP
jgi:CHASE1-domain containing sensor protein